jgi:serine/threonine protein kinase
MHLNDIERGAVNDVVNRFLTEGLPTPRLPLVKRLGDPDVLIRLLNVGLLKPAQAQGFFPTALAFGSCGNSEIASGAKQSLEIALHVVRDLFDTENKTFFVFEELMTRARKLYPNLQAKSLQLGLYLAPEFGVFANYATSTERPEVVHVEISENILKLRDIEHAWDDHIRHRGEELPSREQAAEPNIKPAAEHGWERISQLGRGGQSDVFLVRSPGRVADRGRCLQQIADQMGFKTQTASRILAEAAWGYARPDEIGELGALKVFKAREEGAQAQQQADQRLRTEIDILQKAIPGVLKILDSDVEERWIVTEYFPEGSLQKQPERYSGAVAAALTAFRSLVYSVAQFHKDGIVHRDIKPANIFVGTGNTLILGDFGIVYVPDERDRATLPEERVGSRSFMPSWADLGVRLEKVEPNFDVYMLGKLLWCMVSGKEYLPREKHRDEFFDLTRMFPEDPLMHMINGILDLCIVDAPQDCLGSAQKLLEVVDDNLGILNRNGQPLGPSIPRPCRICGKGQYRSDHAPSHKPQPTLTLKIDRNPTGSDYTLMHLQPFICDYCFNVQFFKKP